MGTRYSARSAPTWTSSTRSPRSRPPPAPDTRTCPRPTWSSPRPPRNNVKKNWRRRLARWVLIGAVAAFLITALPVVAMRWMDPWYSAFMLDAALDATRRGESSYRTDYRWADLEQISPLAAVAVIAAEDQ